MIHAKYFCFDLATGTEEENLKKIFLFWPLSGAGTFVTLGTSFEQI